MENIYTPGKRTTSARSSGSSESSSPTEKRPKSQEEVFERCDILEDAGGAGSKNEQDETLPALNMGDDTEKKLNEILKKLEKLDTIEATLNDVSSRLAKSELAVAKLQTDAGVMKKSITEMDKGLSSLNEEVAELRSQIEEKGKEIEKVRTKHLYLESYSRRENLKFFGIPEREVSASEGGEAINTSDIVYEFMANALGLEDPRNNIEIQRVHRIGKSVDGKPRPILARFLRFPDRERVYQAGFGLRETNFMVLQDFPQEIIERRRKQMPKLKEAKSKGQRVSFSKAEPDRLFINGKFIPM